MGLMPKQKPGRSKQDYSTPQDFMRAVESRFGSPTWDLAASFGNRKAPNWIGVERDSLSVAWHELRGPLWLNPPFANIAPWAEKCLNESIKGARVLFLTPASVGSNWYRDFIHDRARVLFLNGRITFEGCGDPYPKDCMLTIFGDAPGIEIWTWAQAKTLLKAA
jgi:site-specific DNA-methyltransferase (adenine-specific)